MERLCPHCGRVVPLRGATPKSGECHCPTAGDGQYQHAATSDTPRDVSYRGTVSHFIAVLLGLSACLMAWSFFRYFFPDYWWLRFPWFIWPQGLHLLAVLLHLFYTRGRFYCVTAEAKRKNWLYFHTLATVVVAVVVVLSWLFLTPPTDRDRGVPWLAFVLLGQLLLALEHVLYVFRRRDRITPHWVLYVIGNIEIYMGWALSPGGLMWFLFPLAIWGAALVVYTAVLLWLSRRNAGPQNEPRSRAVVHHTGDGGTARRLTYSALTLPAPVMSINPSGSPGTPSAFHAGRPDWIRASHGRSPLPPAHKPVVTPITSPF